jgi:hypothetical protein
MARGPNKPNKSFNSRSAALARMTSKGSNVCSCGKGCGRFTKCLDCFEKEKIEKLNSKPEEGASS